MGNSSYFPFLQVKQSENEASLSQLQSRLEYLDSLPQDRLASELVIGLVAGNMFDWGAKAIVDIMKSEEFGLKEAIRKLPSKLIIFSKTFNASIWNY